MEDVEVRLKLGDSGELHAQFALRALEFLSHSRDQIKRCAGARFPALAAPPTDARLSRQAALAALTSCARPTPGTARRLGFVFRQGLARVFATSRRQTRRSIKGAQDSMIRARSDDAAARDVLPAEDEGFVGSSS